MAPQKAIFTHYNPDIQKGDVNRDIEILAQMPPGAGGGSDVYTIEGDGKPVRLEFAGAGVAGPITHEVLAAIILDRLAGFQTGMAACPENAEAIKYFTLGLKALHARTARRIRDNLEGKVAEAKPAGEQVVKPTSRIMLTATELYIAGVRIRRNDLSSRWDAWNQVSSSVIKMSPPATAVELQTLKDYVAAGPSSLPAFKNGWAEAQQAIKNAGIDL